MIGEFEQVEQKHSSLVGVMRGLLHVDKLLQLLHVDKLLQLLHVDKHSRLSAVSLRNLLLSIQKDEIQRIKLVCICIYIYIYLYI